MRLQPGHFVNDNQFSKIEFMAIYYILSRAEQMGLPTQSTCVTCPFRHGCFQNSQATSQTVLRVRG
jgi:hypothetical protein